MIGGRTACMAMAPLAVALAFMWDFYTAKAKHGPPTERVR